MQNIMGSGRITSKAKMKVLTLERKRDTLY